MWRISSTPAFRWRTVDPLADPHLPALLPLLILGTMSYLHLAGTVHLQGPAGTLTASTYARTLTDDIWRWL